MTGHTAQDAGKPPALADSFQIEGGGATSAQRGGQAVAEAVHSLGFPLRRQEQVQEPSTSRGLPAASGTRGGGALFSGEGPGTSCVNHSQMGTFGSFPPAPALGVCFLGRGSTSPSSGSPHLLLLWGAFPGQRGALPHLPGAPIPGL